LRKIIWQRVADCEEQVPQRHDWSVTSIAASLNAGAKNEDRLVPGFDFSASKAASAAGDIRFRRVGPDAEAGTPSPQISTARFAQGISF